jgi:hypothetical protein
MGRNHVLVLLAAAMVGTALPAQEVSTLMPGERVRIKSTDLRGEFIVRSAGQDSLVVGTMTSDETWTLPVESLRSVEVSGGKRSRPAAIGRGAGFGALLGASVGAVLGFADGDDECAEGNWCIIQFSAADKAVMGGLAVGVLGGAVGGILGAANPGERWQRVPIRRLSAGPTVGGGFAAAVSVGF